MTMSLSQSEFSTYLRRPKHLWARSHNQYQRSSQTKHPRIDIQTLAKEYVEKIVSPNFSDPKLIDHQKVENEKAKAQIELIIEDQADDKKYLLMSRAATSSNSVFIQQLAFQVIAAEKKYSFDRIFLVLLNPRYMRREDLEVERLFQIIEVTTAVEKEIQYVREKILHAIEVISEKNPDHLGSCVYPETCPCPHLCHPNLPEYSIYDVSGLHTKQKIELRNNGILKLTDIPLEYLDQPKMLQQKQLTSSQSAKIDKQAITKHLKELEYPIHFLDYEAFGFPIPLYEGHWPMSQVVFQYSLHILNKDGNVEHHEFLHTHNTDPTKPIIESLKQTLTSQGSIVVWDATLESQVHRHLAQMSPQDMLFLLDLNQRIFDLQTIFKSGLFVDYRFKASNSLKKILPVFDESLNHADLPISHGLEAANVWYNYVYHPDEIEDKQKTRQDLLTYCAQDTLGCVRILEKLQELD